MNKHFIIIPLLFLCYCCSLEQLETETSSPTVEIEQNPKKEIEDSKQEKVEINQDFSYKDTILNVNHKYQKDFMMWLLEEKGSKKKNLIKLSYFRIELRLKGNLISNSPRSKISFGHRFEKRLKSEKEQSANPAIKNSRNIRRKLIFPLPFLSASF